MYNVHEGGERYDCELEGVRSGKSGFWKLISVLLDSSVECLNSFSIFDVFFSLPKQIFQIA